MSERDRHKWDDRYAAEEYVHGHEPSSFLKEHRDKLPRGGKALDIAAGEGQDAVYLAQEGFDVVALDISAVGLRKAQALAERRGTHIAVGLVDLERAPLPPGPFDVIVCMHYKQRALAAQITQALAPGGALVMELATLDNLKLHKHPSRRYLVEPNELMAWFPELSVAVYREGVFDDHAVAQLVATRPRVNG